jgi:type I restriction-modification system DNA methylase subunit
MCQIYPLDKSKTKVYRKVMSEELLQRKLLRNPEKVGRWDFYNIGSTTLNELKNAGIIPRKEYKTFGKRKPDGIIAKNRKVVAVIENKSVSKFKTEKQKQDALQQGIEVAQILGSHILILTDTVETIWINALTGSKIQDEEGNELRYNFDPDDIKTAELIEKIIISISDQNNRIKPKNLVNPTDLAKQIWQDIWSVSGATPENCLYTFVELFIFKYLSDLGVLQGVFSFDSLLKNYSDNNKEEMLEYYAGTIRPKIKDLFKENPIDKTTIINGTIFVSKDQKAVKGYSTVFKKILDKFEKYGKLEYIDKDFKSQLFESFLKESISKKNWGQFFTPLRVVRSMVNMAESDITSGKVICDPACGVGKFLLEAIVGKLNYFYRISNEEIKSNITIHGFDKGFDKDEQKTIILAKANMLIYFSDLVKENPGLTNKFSELFNKSFELKTNSILGTLSDPVKEEYDVILTNPPYVTSGSSNLKEEINKDTELDVYYEIKAMGVEGLFMEWIIRALKSGGKAFVVVPDGIFNRQNDSNLRQFILNECIVEGIISLPIKTFFTTSKKTYILCITKKNNKNEKQTTPVFTYLVSEIGESRDIYRFNIEQDDLLEAVTWYNQFKNTKKTFRCSDPRCKIQPIEKFTAEGYWSVDRWWTKEEQIAIGILEENKTLSLNGFSEIVNDISETLKEYSTQLREIGEKKKSVINFAKIYLSDSRFFSLFIGKRLLKRELRHIQGTIPVYSANVKQPIALHNQSNIDDFSNNFVIWGIDGDFEYNYIHKNTPFVTTDHCGTIRILDDSILPEYLMVQLINAKHIYGFDRGLRASLKNMQNVFIEMPVCDSGIFDIKKQNEIIDKYKYVSGLRQRIIEYEKQLEEINIESDIIPENMSIFLLQEIFDIERGKSKYTKKYGHINKGNYPVYSASNNSPLTNINTFDYDGIYLTWATNGFAGYMKLITGKFSINADRGLLKPKRKDIDLLYIKYLLEPRFREMAKGRKGEKGEDEFTKVYPTMIKNIEIAIPIISNDQFDLYTQRKIAERYMQIDQIRKNISDELNIIVNSVINFL